MNGGSFISNLPCGSAVRSTRIPAQATSHTTACALSRLVARQTWEWQRLAAQLIAFGRPFRLCCRLTFTDFQESCERRALIRRLHAHRRCDHEMDHAPV